MLEAGQHGDDGAQDRTIRDMEKDETVAELQYERHEQWGYSECTVRIVVRLQWERPQRTGITVVVID